MTDSLKALIEACRNGEANDQDLVDRVPYARFLGIELLVRGEPGELDFRAWRAAAEYEGGFGDAHPAVETFWRVAQGLAPKRKRRLLFFVTGCGRAPAGEASAD